ncbi:MAG: hypothetical protein KF778_02755 [Rhodocyclaceae bacterium]|nr:hypothetical protein [Rhodocyclaceae bacterium]MBX3667297.1 hypothetical protein [Rhodocyclaceae bacterium]
MNTNRIAPGKLSMAAACAALLALLPGCDWIDSKLHPPPDLKFIEAGAEYSAKPDLAEVEYRYPLTPAELSQLTPKNIAHYTQEQVDQIYARLTPGAIPDGVFDGGLFFPRGTSGKKRLAEIVGGLPGLAVQLKTQKLELIGATLWQGKVFYRDEGVLRNRISDLSLLKPLIDGDPATLPQLDAGGKHAWLMFPAKLYCGQSLLDSRRESVIIDYYFSDDLPGYRERPDYLASRRGFKVRDEIRMVRPGFYLGRAYLDRVFLLNFTLYNAEIAERDGDGFRKTGQVPPITDKNGETVKPCWPGTQQRARAPA